ncbi:Universal stress protein family protein [Mycolicibacterium rutilum]|uniref:Universal stress protein family protein n=1 Tax=Mycolicibacterium rutilum TaxID=370526 RepID=A0A1H6IYN5_MYCRU|nr:Universal stress protein family protein [Mycolicibacterium rutilum]
MATRHIHSSRQSAVSSQTLPSSRLGVVVGIGTGVSTTATQWATHHAATHRIPLTLVTTGTTASQTIKTGWDSLPLVRAIAVDAPLEHTLIQLSAQAEIVALGNDCPSTHRTLSALVRRGHSNVASIPEAAADLRLPVIVLIDGLRSSEPAIRAAFDEASRRHASLIAVHTWSEPGHLGFPAISWSPIEWANNREQEREVLAERLAGFQELYPDVRVRRITTSDSNCKPLVTDARSAQLIVVGTGANAKLADISRVAAFRQLTTSEVPVLVAKR